MNTQVQHRHMNRIRQLEIQVASIQKGASDVTVHPFLANIDTLQQAYKTDKTVISFLKMMHSIGKYVERKKERAHADSFSVLARLITGLDSVLNFELTPSEAQRILKDNYVHFNGLKQKLVAGSPEQNRIYELKTALLSLEWEINPQTLSLYRQKINDLKLAWHHNRLYGSFLNILNILGKYIELQKENAHKGTLAFIRTVYDHLEQVILNPGMPFAIKKKILDRDIEKLNVFKRAVSQKTMHAGTKIVFQDLKPALSQYKGAGTFHHDLPDEFFPLTDEQALACDHETDDILEPAPVSSDTSHRDVMDDLFNPKASPVDELLDRIHLMNALGEDQTTDPHGRKDDMTAESTEIREVVSSRTKAKKPRREISHRIETFFDMNPGQPLPESGKEKKEKPVFSEKSIQQIPFQTLRLLIDRATESMNPEDLEKVIHEISKQNRYLSQNAENTALNHLFISCGKLFEQLSDRFVRENNRRSKKNFLLVSRIKKLFNP